MSFTFGKDKGFKKAAPGGPPEQVELQVCLTQKVQSHIPYMTPRAGAIRAAMNANITTPEGNRIFMFRKDDNSWTNVAIDSTPHQPKITCDPIYAVEKAYNVFSRLSDVSNVKITDDAGKTITLADVKQLPFRSLEDVATDVPPDDDDDDELASAIVDLKQAQGELKDRVNILDTRVDHLDMNVATELQNGLKTTSGDLAELRALYGMLKEQHDNLNEKLEKLAAPTTTTNAVDAVNTPPHGGFGSNIGYDTALGDLGFNDASTDAGTSSAPSSSGTPAKLSRLERAALKRKSKPAADEHSPSVEPSTADDDISEKARGKRRASRK